MNSRIHAAVRGAPAGTALPSFRRSAGRDKRGAARADPPCSASTPMALTAPRGHEEASDLGPASQAQARAQAQSLPPAGDGM